MGDGNIIEKQGMDLELEVKQGHDTNLRSLNDISHDFKTENSMKNEIESIETIPKEQLINSPIHYGIRGKINAVRFDNDQIQTKHLNEKTQLYESSSIKSKKFPCDQCENTFTRLHNLKIHVKSVHYQIKDLTCNLCPYASADRGNLVKHMRNRHNISN